MTAPDAFSEPGQPEIPRRRLVVAGAIVGPDGRVLAARRVDVTGSGHGSRWEFPGGKVESGESPREALVRELFEELAVDAVVGAELVHPAGAWPINESLEMRVFVCRLTDASSGPTMGHSHDEVRWCTPSELLRVDWLPADVPVARELASPGTLDDLLGRAHPGTEQASSLAPADRRRQESPSPSDVPRCPVLIANPVAPGHEQLVSLLEREARTHGWPTPRLLLTTADDFGGGQATQALAWKSDLVIVAGGDGTVRRVADVLRGTRVPLAVVPCGTANIFARNLGLRRRHLQRAVETIFNGHDVAIDVGVAQVRLASTSQFGGEQVFLVLAGMGHDAATVAGTRHGLKRRLHWLAYFESGARHLLARPLRMTVSVDGGDAHESTVWSLLVGNVGRIPMGIQVFPGADLQDGHLHTLLAHVEHWWQWSSVAAAALAPHKKFRTLERGVAVTLHATPRTPLEVQLDGDVEGPVTQAHFRVEPGALLVRVPRSSHFRESAPNSPSPTPVPDQSPRTRSLP
ncbi:diacylglycerol kinase family protein [Luteococcus sp. Sow4_B9]|uniref:diacylglycerol kinase family protein n=1 Tax=Luteococcus sp. Sow4_B9 TaxID=3438792 RepID=UPI003F961CF3